MNSYFTVLCQQTRSADTPIVVELKQMNIIIGMWKKSWITVSRIPHQRTLLAAQTLNWSDKVSKFAGMV